MNFKFIVYLVCMTLFSFFSFFKGAEGVFLIFSLLVLALINYFYYNLYNSFLKISKEKISNGLFYSSIIGMILFIPLFLGDFSYTTINGNISTTTDLLLPLGIAIYLLSMVICFFIDAFFNKNIKAIRGSIILGSFSFYIGLYFINAFLSLLLGGAHALSGG